MKSAFSIGMLLLLCLPADAACNWPAVFAGSTWRDSHRGDITFTTTTMTGWDFTVDTYTVDDWECHIDQLDSTGFVVAVATTTFVKLSINYYAYLCMKLTKITDYSYMYYESFQPQPNSNNERIYNGISNTVTDLSSICDTANGASGGEFRVLIKQGSESSAKQNCPTPLLARFDYSHTTAGGTPTCDASTDNWDVCTDRMQMTFDYTTCTKKVAYTASGTSWCVASVQVGDTWFVSTYNNDDATVDDSTTYRFSCFAINTEGTKASAVPKGCRYQQTVDAFPVETTTAGITVTNTNIGATLTMTSFITCPFTTTTTTTTAATTSAEETDNGMAVGLGVGLGLGLPLILCTTVLIFLICTKRISLDRCRKSNRSEFTKSPPRSAAPSKGRSRGQISPNGVYVSTTDVVTVTEAETFEGLEMERTTLNPENYRPVTAQTAPAKGLSPRYDSPLPQQILTPREPSAYPLSLSPNQQTNQL